MPTPVGFFLFHLESNNVLSDCWQDSGFYPEISNARESDVLVWASEVFICGCFSGVFFDVMSRDTGRMLPEVIKGLDILGCQAELKVLGSVVSMFGHEYPRKTATRLNQCIQIGESIFEDLVQDLLTAWEMDEHDSKSEAYALEYCNRYGLIDRS